MSCSSATHLSLAAYLRVQVHLVGDQVRVRAHALGMPTRHAIVTAEGCQLDQEFLGRLLGSAKPIGGGARLDGDRKLTTGGGAQRESKAQRSLVGEQQRRPHQHRHRNDAAESYAHDPQDGGGKDAETHEPGQQQTEIVDGARHHPDGQADDRIRHDEGPDRSHHPEAAAQDRSRAPRSLVEIHRLAARRVTGGRAGGVRFVLCVRGLRVRHLARSSDTGRRLLLDPWYRPSGGRTLAGGVVLPNHHTGVDPGRPQPWVLTSLTSGIVRSTADW